MTSFGVKPAINSDFCLGTVIVDFCGPCGPSAPRSPTKIPCTYRREGRVEEIMKIGQVPRVSMLHALRLSQCPTIYTCFNVLKVISPSKKRCSSQKLPWK